MAATEDFPAKVRAADEAEASQGSVAAERTAEKTETAELSDEDRAAREAYLRMWPLDAAERR